jgi:hypothetical protein
MTATKPTKLAKPPGPVQSAPAPKRRGHPGVAPWQSLPSLRAGLPHDRAGWLAVVLPTMDAVASHHEAARLLTESGHKVDAKSVQLWHRKLADMQAAGTLTERSAPLPERRAGWREGMPLPSAQQAAEGGRKGAATRWGGKRGKGARKGPRKAGKVKP